MNTDADPVSWLLVEPGWHVPAAGGEVVGYVVDVLGEPDLGIFDDLVVTRKPRQWSGRDPLSELYRSAVGLRELDASRTRGAASRRSTFSGSSRAAWSSRSTSPGPKVWPRTVRAARGAPRRSDIVGRKRGVAQPG